MTREEAIKVAYGIPVTKAELEALQFLIPDLADSKDERIRKALIKAFEEKVQKSFEWKDGIPNNAVLDWLERQKDAFENGRQLGIMQEQARQELEGVDENKKEEEGYEAIPVESTLEYKLGFKAGKESEKQNHDGKKWIFEDEYQKDLDRLYNEGKDEVLNNPAKYGLQKEQKQLFSQIHDSVMWDSGLRAGIELEKKQKEQKSSLAPERIRPKFAVGDTVCRPMWSDHTIQEIYINCNDPVYVCVNEEGTESHIPFSEQDEWERKELKTEERNYDNRVQYDNVKSGIEAFASTYSFNIESKLFPQLTKEQQRLWREEIEQAVIAGGEDGIELSRDNRYKENRMIGWSEEDEKINKALIKMISDIDGGYPFEKYGIFKKDALAYLEKQKEEEGYEAIPIESTLEYKAGKHAGFLEGLNEGRKQKESLRDFIDNFPYSDEQKEQKPAEKQDYSGLNDSERAIHRGFLIAGVDNVSVDIIKDTAKECIANFPWPTKWSKEDENTINELCNIIVSNSKNGYLGRYYAGDLVQKLKSLRPEPKSAEWSDDKFPKEIERDATQFCFDKGINITPHQAKEIATHYLMVGHNEGYVKGRKDAHIPARELGLPKSMDFKQEWSEEDELHRGFILESLEDQLRFCKKDAEGAHYAKQIRTAQNWLKDLRPHWKPSKEEMEALDVACSGKLWYGEIYLEGLRRIREQLRKL